MAYGYDGKGRVSSVQTRASSAVGTWTTVSSGHAYEPFGAVKAMALGNGLAVAILRQAQDDRVVSRRLYRTSDGTSLSWLAYGSLRQAQGDRKADGNIGAITNQLAAAGSMFNTYAGG